MGHLQAIIPRLSHHLISGLLESLADVQLEWSLAFDPDVGPATGATYNVRVGTTPGGSDIVAPTANGAGNNGTTLNRTR